MTASATRRVVNILDRPVGQGLPQGLVLFCFPQRRRQHVFNAFHRAAVTEFLFCQQ